MRQPRAKDLRAEFLRILWKKIPEALLTRAIGEALRETLHLEE